MIWITHILLGFFLSFIGTLPLSIINLTVAETAMKRTLRDGLIMATGACIIEFFQTFIGIRSAIFFTQQPIYTTIFNLIAIPVFFGLSIYYFISYRKQHKKRSISIHHSKLSPFFRGMMISSLNVMILPYWMVWGTYLHLHGWLQLDLGILLVFSTATTFGTFVALFLYAKMGIWVIGRLTSASDWMNLIISIVFFTMGVWQVYKIISAT